MPTSVQDLLLGQADYCIRIFKTLEFYTSVNFSALR